MKEYYILRWNYYVRHVVALSNENLNNDEADDCEKNIRLQEKRGIVWRETTMIRFKVADECREHYDIDVGISGVIFHQGSIYFIFPRRIFTLTTLRIQVKKMSVFFELK